MNDNNTCNGAQEEAREYYPLLNHSGPRNPQEPSCGFAPGDIWEHYQGANRTKRIIVEVRDNTILYTLRRKSGLMIFARPVVKTRPTDWIHLVETHHLNCYRDGKLIYRWDTGAVMSDQFPHEELGSLRRQNDLLKSLVNEKQKKIDELSATAFCGCPGIDIFSEWRAKVAQLQSVEATLRKDLSQVVNEREKYRAEALENSKQCDECEAELRERTKLLRRICNHFCVSYGTGRPQVSKDSIPYDSDLHAEIFAFMESGAGR